MRPVVATARCPPPPPTLLLSLSHRPLAVCRRKSLRHSFGLWWFSLFLCFPYLRALHDRIDSLGRRLSWLWPRAPCVLVSLQTQAPVSRALCTPGVVVARRFVGRNFPAFFPILRVTSPFLSAGSKAVHFCGGLRRRGCFRITQEHTKSGRRETAVYRNVSEVLSGVTVVLLLCSRYVALFFSL